MSARTHGHSRPASRTYASWYSMNARCYRATHTEYHRYGKRGIAVCKRWRRGNSCAFENFLTDMGACPSTEYSIERIYNNRGYSPKNCTWANKKVQSNNKRNNRRIKYRGETKTLAQWSDHLGINYNSLCSRFTKGWSVKRTLMTPIRPHKPYRNSRNSAKVRA